MGNFKDEKQAIVTIIASNKNWIESEAIEQLQNAAKLEGIKMAVGLPDLHPGKGYPIGAAFISKDWIYPQLVGNDIGCGMGFWETNLKAQKLKLDKWSSKLHDLESSWDGDIQSWLNERNIEQTDFDKSLGTIGGGNHFAELQKIEAIPDEGSFVALGLNKQNLYLLVHSGSRGLGDSILHSHTVVHGHQGLHKNTIEAQQYIDRHNKAVQWAEANRALIAHRFLSRLGSDGKLILDVNHNTVTAEKIGDYAYLLHRKGATPSTQGLVIIPGSRGDFSYLVEPIGSQDDNAYSLAHGAGRKWKRSDAKGKLANYKQDDFCKTPLGSRVICENKDLIFEEAPQAYKNIETVVQDLLDRHLIKVIAILRPVITYKTRRHKC